MLETEIIPSPNYRYPDIQQGEKTMDKVWLLSVEEWLALPQEYQNTVSTFYATCRGALGNIYWLRTNGNRAAYACVVRNGELWLHGYYCIGSRKTKPVTGFRPVIRIEKQPT